MLVDQLYTDVPTGTEFFLCDKKTSFIKDESCPFEFLIKNKKDQICGRFVLNAHSIVLVESDKILLTKEEFLNRFPQLRINHVS